MKNTISRIGLALLIVSLTLTACGGAATTAPAPTDAPPTTAPVEAPASTEAPATTAPEPTTAAEPVTLTIWATGSEDEAKGLQAGADEFQKAHPNVTIEVQAVSWDDAHAKMLTAATTGQGPDMITGGLSWGIEFGQLGGMIDLRAQYPDLESEIAKIAHPQVYESVVSPEGEVYGVQWDLTVMQTYYRKDLISEPPETWEELTSLIEKEQTDGKKGFAMQWGNTQWLQYFNYLYAAGGSLYDKDCTQATVNSPEGVTALKFYADLYTKYNAPTDGWPDLEGGLESGDYAIGITGSWIAGSLDPTRPNLAGKWALAPLPTGPSGKRTSFIGGRIIGIMSYSPNPDTSAQFIRSLYNVETQEAMTARMAELNILYIPPSVEYVDLIQAPADRVAAIKTTLLDAAGPPNCVGWEESSKELEKQVQEVIFNGADPQAALDASAEAMNAALVQ